MKYKLLIVDDETANLRLLDRLLSPEYQCLTASSGAEAIRLLDQHDVAIIITDQRMPEMTGIQLLKQTAAKRPHMVRILLTGYTDVEALVEAINSGLVYLYFTKPWNNDALKFQLNRALEHYENNRRTSSLSLANERLLFKLKEIKQSIICSLAAMGATRSEETYEHALRVRYTARAIAEQLGLDEDEQESISAAALLNDLQANVSARPAATVGVRNAARSHAQCEASLLSSIPEFSDVIDILTSVRENFDGSGNPRGAKAEQIPIGSRILRVADEYNSILRPKSSAAAMTHEEAMRFLSQRGGKQFDPSVILVMERLGPSATSDETSEFPGASTRRFQAFASDRFEPSLSETLCS